MRRRRKRRTRSKRKWRKKNEGGQISMTYDESTRREEGREGRRERGER